MRNPLKRRPRNNAKPTLRERAAFLKARAGRVIRRKCSEPETALPAATAIVPEGARIFAVEQAALIDLSGLRINHLALLFDRFEQVASMWNAELHLPYCDESGNGFRVNTAAGDLVEREQERAAEIRDRIAAEIGRRQPSDQWEAAAQLETLIRHELMCNGDLRDPAIRARIKEAWGA